MNVLLAIDPGPKVSGWVTLNEAGEILECGVDAEVPIQGMPTVVVEKPVHLSLRQGKGKSVDLVQTGIVAG